MNAMKIAAIITRTVPPTAITKYGPDQGFVPWKNPLSPRVGTSSATGGVAAWAKPFLSVLLRVEGTGVYIADEDDEPSELELKQSLAKLEDRSNADELDEDDVEKMLLELRSEELLTPQTSDEDDR